jgi:exosortase/archaeosortase family protein
VYVLAAVPLSVIKNAARIFTIVELGTRVNPDYFGGELHHSGGFVFLLGAICVDIVLLWFLRKGETKGRVGCSEVISPSC